MAPIVERSQTTTGFNLEFWLPFIVWVSRQLLSLFFSWPLQWSAHHCHLRFLHGWVDVHISRQESLWYHINPIPVYWRLKCVYKRRHLPEQKALAILAPSETREKPPRRKLPSLFLSSLPKETLKDLNNEIRNVRDSNVLEVLAEGSSSSAHNADREETEEIADEEVRSSDNWEYTHLKVAKICFKRLGTISMGLHITISEINQPLLKK